MYNPWAIIAKYFEKKEEEPELEIEEYINYNDPHIQEMSDVRNKEVVCDNTTCE
jgi:hypothetical protein